MDEALDVELHDELLVDEIQLVTELIVVAHAGARATSSRRSSTRCSVSTRSRTFFPQQRLG